MARKRIREASKGVGKPRIGGDFDLVDQDGKRFTNADMKGKFTLVSTRLHSSEEDHNLRNYRIEAAP